ncbi:hypothetical protein HKW80_40145, partial [Pseudomonas aeruginosa]|nr:hypothetical protein [Pseudomonas aeruginosa]
MNTELALINRGPAAFAPARRSDEGPHMSRTWIRNPLAIFTANGLDAAGGLVVED